LKAILVASKNLPARDVIRASMRSEYALKFVDNRDDCLSLFGRQRHEFLFIDVGLLRKSNFENNYKEALQPFWHLYPSAAVIVMSSQELIREAVKAVKAGASDYLTYPINPEEVKYVTQSVYETAVMESELDYLRDQFWEHDALEVVRTKSPLMKELFRRLQSVAPTKSTVLFVGETGTGKGVMAKLIHQHSSRKDGPFISVHCGAIPDTLLESELFGHEKGAFTGATRRKLGKFEIAQGGTIFLDEIGTISPPAQIKLLEVLQDGRINRVGGENTINADVRVVAATNEDLAALSADGQFRKDLYYRLNVFPVELPPLRQRMEDLPSIVEIILNRLRRLHTKEIHGIQPEVMEGFKNYLWPGNIRELENLLERAYIIEDSSILTTESFPGDLFAYRFRDTVEPINGYLSLADVRRKGVEEIERSYLKEVLAANNGRIKDAAGAAGISTRQLHKLMKKYGLKKEAFKGETL
jgi:DNA-binding NtrC family response regulator